jgi:phage-Barnase-EndoU-ColicinE5/D-RelE like nuclease3
VRSKPLNLSKISELVAYARDATNTENREEEFGFFPNFQAQQINQATQVRLNDAIKIITSDGLRHAMKEHGNHVEENKRGQKGLTDADLNEIPNIVANFDSVQKGNTKRGQPGVLFIKTINNVKYFVAMTLYRNRGDEKLQFSTMYAKPQ